MEVSNHKSKFYIRFCYSFIHSARVIFTQIIRGIHLFESILFQFIYNLVILMLKIKHAI